MSDEVALIRSTRGVTTEDKVVHTDPDCPSVRQGNSFREATPEERETVPECERCAGTWTPVDGGDRSYYQAAVNTDL